MARVVGVELAADAARAVEIDGAGRPRRTAEVGLARGVVTDGEIADPAALAAALRTLWRRGRFGTRRVVLGVASRSVATRQAVLPTMALDDMRSALSFEVAELLPFALDEAIVDLAVLGDAPATGGPPRSRLLVAAVRRPAVAAWLQAATQAKLEVVAIDPVAVALARAGADPDGPALPPGAAELVAAVVNGVVNVAVLQEGRPLLARSLPVGEDAVVSSQIENQLATIQLYMAGSDGAGVGTLPMAPGRADPVLEAVRGAFDSFQTQPDMPRLERIVVLGDEARVATLVADLAPLVRVPVLAGTTGTLRSGPPLPGRFVGALALARHQAHGIGGVTFRLLPPEVLRRREQRQVVAVATVVTLAVALGLGAWTVTDRSRVAAAETEAAGAEAGLTRLRAELESYRDVLTLRSELERSRAGLRELVAGELDWPRLLRAVEAAATDGSRLEAVTFTRPGEQPGPSGAGPAQPASEVGLDPAAGEAGQAAAGQAPAAPAATAPAAPADRDAGGLGTLRITVTGPGLATAGRWLDALAQVPGLANPWLESSETVEGGIRFVLSAVVGTEALTGRAAAGQP